MKTRIRSYLENTSPSVFNVYCMFAAFCTYFCMYAFRKPFSVGTFEGAAILPGLPEMDYKILFIITQVLGYTLSKFIGIKVVAEMSRNKRALAIIGMILFAELSLVGFATVPRPYNAAFLFLNGIPLGMVWGMVFGFLEGRKSTELLGAGLSASYILASGVVKSVGRWVILQGIDEYWMPFVTGAIFFPAILIFVYMLSCIPHPTKEDEELRVKRAPMDARARLDFFSKFAPGLISLTGLYMLLTAYRDFRDNFAREIWDAIGYANEPGIFTYAEIPIAVIVLVSLALVMKIKENTKAFFVVHLLMLSGVIITGVSTLCYQTGIMDPALWMVAVGLGNYLAYVPYGCILFDRLIATVGVVATAGFLIYVTDAFGYLGSVFLLLYKNFGHADLSWLNFFIGFSYVTSIVCSTCFIYSMVYFGSRHRKQKMTTNPR